MVIFNMKFNEIAGPSVEEVGAMYAKYKTDDWQGRDGAYPESGVPDSVANAGSYGDEAFLEFSFKNTSEGQAKNWVKRFLQSKKLPMTSMTSGQDGDYADDWVIVAVTYKAGVSMNESRNQFEVTIEFNKLIAPRAVNMLNALYKKEGVGANAFLGSNKYMVDIDIDDGIFGGIIVDVTDRVLDELRGIYTNLDPIISTMGRNSSNWGSR